MSELNKNEIEEEMKDSENNNEFHKKNDKNNNEQVDKTKQKEINEKILEKFHILQNAEFSKIIGNYLLFEQIGKGSFSKVAKAIHLVTEQIVAVKILEKDKIEDEIDIERIIREIEILKTIMHPNVAQMYETYSTSHNIYLMMEYIEGGDLFDYITSNSYLSEPIACNIYRQIISVLDYLSKMGISHRDIKPENILLDKSHKNIKIIDFGLSNYCKNKELLHSSCGSPCYASPEMLSGKPYLGVMTDLWSSGVVLYSMLVGSLPFDDQEIYKLYEQIKIGRFYLPSTLSLEAIDLLKKVLEVNPKKRITLKEIKEHPWFNKVHNPLNKGIIYNDNNKFPCDNNIVSFVINNYYKDDKNINKNSLIEFIENHESNKYTATYYLVKNYMLKTEDNNLELSSDIDNNDKNQIKSKNKKFEIDSEEKDGINRKENDNIIDTKNKRCKTEDNLTINKNKNKNDDKNNPKENVQEKNKIREVIKKEIPKLELNNVNIISKNNNNVIVKNNQYTIRGISPSNILNNNLYDLNSKKSNNFINLNIDDNTISNHFNNKNLYKDKNIRKKILYLDNVNVDNNANVNIMKNKEIILSLSNNDENLILNNKKNNNQNKSLVPFKHIFEDEIKMENNIIAKKKANSHRKKFFNMIPKLNYINTNIDPNLKQKKNVYIMDYINNKDINNSNYSISKNNYNNKNINSNKNKNYILSYLNSGIPKNTEKDNKRNLSSGIKDKIQISKTSKNKKILFGTKLGLLSKVNFKNNINNNIIRLNINNNNYNNRSHLSRNNNKNEDINRTKYSEFTKSSEKYNYIISPRTLEQKNNNNNRVTNFNVCQNYNGITNLKNIEKHKTLKLGGGEKIKKLNGINLSNINNIGNNNNLGLNNLINENYLNRANTINNNIILNIKNYYNRKNNRTYDKNKK